MIGDIYRARELSVMEMMDDFTITDERLERALSDLRIVNRYLGGYAATMSELAPWLLARKGGRVRVVDLGTGVADFPEYLLRWADRNGVHVHVSAVDLNGKTVELAGHALDERLSAPLRKQVEVVEGDALSLDYPDGAFDVATTALFMHHLPDDEAVALLREMGRVSRHGLLVNDLHRHVLALYGIRLLGAVLPVGEMFRHDGPLSVLRGFTRSELERLAERAGLENYQVRWHWAFRWILSTL